MYCCDRSSLTNYKERDIDILIAVPKDIPAFPLNNPEHSIEQSFIKFKLDSLKYIIGTIYFSSSKRDLISYDSYDLFFIDTVL